MNDNHCKDCCCARAWDALGISTYTGRSIPEHIAVMRELMKEKDAEIGRLRGCLLEIKEKLVQLREVLK